MSNLVVNTNVLALNSHKSLKGVGSNIAKASQRLSSGLRVNSAADDAAGLAISEKMRSQVRGLDQASKNSQDGISMIQTAEGALQESENMLQRMRELVNQAANDTLQFSDREKIALELNELTSEIDATADKTEFNQKKLIDGSWKSAKIYLQVGANASQGLSFNIDQMDADALGVTKADIGNVVASQNSVAVATSSISLSDTTATSFLQKVGIYDFGDGKTIDVRENGEISVSGFTDSATGEVLSNKIYASTDTFSFTADGNTAALTGGSLSFTIEATAAPTGLPASSSGASATYTFSNDKKSKVVVSVAAGASSQSFVFTNIGDMRFIDSTGKAVKGIKEGQTYTASQLASADVASIFGSDGQQYTFETTAGLNDGKLIGVRDYISFSPTTAEGVANNKGKDPISTIGGEVISKLNTKLDKAIENVSSQRAKLGAYQNRLEHTISNLDTSSQNLAAAESRIRDTDMAKEMMNLTKNNVLSQAATSMLAQANQAPQNVLQLLR